MYFAFMKTDTPTENKMKLTAKAFEKCTIAMIEEIRSDAADAVEDMKFKRSLYRERMSARQMVRDCEAELARRDEVSA